MTQISAPISGSSDREDTESRILKCFDLDPGTEVLFCFACHMESCTGDKADGFIAASKGTLFFLSLDAVTKKRIDWVNVVHVAKRSKLLGKDILIQYGKDGFWLVLTGRWQENAVVDMMLAAQREAQPGGTKADGAEGASGTANQSFGKGIRRPQCLSSLPATASGAQTAEGLPFRCCLTAVGLSASKSWVKGDPILLSFIAPLIFHNLLASTVEIQWGESKHEVKTGVAGPWVSVRSGEKLDVPADLKWSLWYSISCPLGHAPVHLDWHLFPFFSRQYFAPCSDDFVQDAIETGSCDRRRFVDGRECDVPRAQSLQGTENETARDRDIATAASDCDCRDEGSWESESDCTK